MSFFVGLGIGVLVGCFVPSVKNFILAQYAKYKAKV